MLLSVLQQTIIRLCDDHERSESGKPGFRPYVILGQFFVKYGDYSLCPQFKTQQYIYEMAAGDKSAPRIPKVYDYFCPEDKMAYLVMEYIDAKPVSPKHVPERVADALQWLYCLPAPPDVVIGPVGGGLAYHRLFQDYEAPVSFSSKEALQRYMNKALKSIPPDARPKEIDFSDECIVFTQSDMEERNFLIDTNDKICMVNFGGVGLLPHSFVISTMRNSGPFAEEVAKYLDWSPTPNLYSMARACGILVMTSDYTLGLDEDGWPVEL